MRSLYNKILSICSKKQSEKFLYFISFIESSVFPIPIVLLMIPVQLVKRNRAMAIGFFVTVFSVLGGRQSLSSSKGTRNSPGQRAARHSMALRASSPLGRGRSRSVQSVWRSGGRRCCCSACGWAGNTR